MCTLMNVCDPDEIPPWEIGRPESGAVPHTTTRGQGKAPITTLEGRENPLKAVHLSDAHLEEAYIEVHVHMLHVYNTYV